MEIRTRIFSLAAVAAALTSTALSQTWKYTLHKIVDPTTKVAAWHVLVPDGWSVEDKPAWNLDKKLMPFSVECTLTSPDSSTQIQLLPSDGFTFTIHDGKADGVVPPETANKSLDAVLSHYHPDLKSAHQDFRQDFPVPFTVPDTKSVGLCGVLQVTFEEGGQTRTELLSSLMLEASQQDSGGNVTGFWSMSNAFTVSSTVAGYKEAYGIAAAVFASFRPETGFAALNYKVTEALNTTTTKPDLQAMGAEKYEITPEIRKSIDSNLHNHSLAIARTSPPFKDPELFATPDGPIMLFGSVHNYRDAKGGFIVTGPNVPAQPGWTLLSPSPAG